tara:strand:- start:37697 stop:38788 length:1092 start_codon:yes stop_codon:yes gene_type:complete
MGKPYIVSKQVGMATWSFGVGVLQNITISSVNLSRTWVRITYRSTSTGAEIESVLTVAHLTSSTNLRLERGGTSKACTIEWAVYEFDDSVNVYRGSFTQSAVTVNTSVTSVNTAKAISECTFMTTSVPTATQQISYTMLRDRLTSSTNLRTNLGIADANSTVHWQVIEFTEGASVANYSGNSTTWPLDVVITAVDDLDKSFLVFSWASNGALLGMCSEDLLSCRYTTSADVVRMEDFFAGAIDKLYSFYTVELDGDDATVDRGYDPVAFGVNTITPGVDIVSSAQSMIRSNCNYDVFAETDTCSNALELMTFIERMSDVSATFQRLSNTVASSIAWEAIDFGVEPEDTVLPNIMNYYYRQRSV